MESPPPASNLPLQDMVWTACQACSPPRAAIFLSTIWAAVSLAGGVLLSAATRASGKHRQSRTVNRNEVLCNMLETPRFQCLGGEALPYFHHDSARLETGGTLDHQCSTHNLSIRTTQFGRAF